MRGESTKPQMPLSLDSFKGVHHGDTIIVCGCGESLNLLELPEQAITIGVNDVGRRFTPNYLVVVNPRNQVVGMIWRFTHAITEPLLKPIRRVIKPFNGLDLTPLVLILVIYLLRDVMWRYIYPNVI